MENQLRWWLPQDISTHGAQIDHLINVLHVFMILLFVGWGIFLIYCLVKFRARPGHQAQIDTKHFKLPFYIEVGVLLFEIFLLVGMSSPAWFSFKKGFPDEKEALVIRIVAEQFAWNIHYPGKDGKFGPVKVQLMDGTNPIGLDRDQADGKDDIFTINNLHVPVGRPVIVRLLSKDVIHSFFLPELRVKQDAIPGSEIPIWFQATQTGEFEIACAQLCGIGHYRMRGQLFVDSPADFDKFLAEEAASLNGDAAAPPAAEPEQKKEGQS